ncbi:hypothetical protein HOY82DRAFT_540140 [Tuber indicum]|nr:hypothetical protein HOY82DRAFT_540140 [Tuber indicum]
METAEHDPTPMSVPAGNYFIKTNTGYLAVNSNHEIVIRADSFKWRVELEGSHNYIINPERPRYIHDTTTHNVLHPARIDHGAWSGASPGPDKYVSPPLIETYTPY